VTVYILQADTSHINLKTIYLDIRRRPETQPYCVNAVTELVIIVFLVTLGLSTSSLLRQPSDHYAVNKVYILLV